MLLREIASYLAQTQGFSAFSDGLAVVQTGGYTQLICTARGENRVAAIGLGTVEAPPTQTIDPVVSDHIGGDMALQTVAGGIRLFVFAAYSAAMRAGLLDAAGLPGRMGVVDSDLGVLLAVTAMELIEFGTTDVAVLAQRNLAGLRLFAMTGSTDPVQTALITDGQKTFLDGISDVVSLQIGAARYVITASALENGLTCLQIGADGQAVVTDSLGAVSGLWVNGPAALQAVEFMGQSFVVLGATLSSSISVVRVNPMGVLFVADHLTDDRSTRFDGIAALDLFAAQGRLFVVAAGTDAGLTVLEMLPGGTLQPYRTFVLETGTGLGAVSGITAHVMGGAVSVFLVDAAAADRIQHFELSLNDLGPLLQATGGVINGTALNDRMIGSAGDDRLQAGAGADFLHDGAGQDVMVGGAGADVFVMAQDAQRDSITDYQSGEDLVDLSAWGRIYSHTVLSIEATATGAQISYGDETLVLIAANGESLAASGFSDADFLF